MRKIVPIHKKKKKEIISKNILERRDIMQEKRKKLSGRKNGCFLKGSSLKEKLRKSALYAEDQVILQKIARKRKKQQSFLNKPRSMQMIFLSRMWNHSFPWMMITPLKLWQSWLILLRKKI